MQRTSPPPAAPVRRSWFSHLFGAEAHPHPVWLEGLLALAALYLAFNGLLRPIWMDEAVSIRVAQQPLAAIATDLQYEVHPPFYYWILHSWMKLAGRSEAGARTLSSLCYLFTLVALLWLGFGLRAGGNAVLFGAILFAISKPAIHNASNVRMYSLMALQMTLATGALVRLIREEKFPPGSAALFLLMNATGLLTHIWYHFALFAQLASIYILCYPPDRRRRVLLLTGLAALPYAFYWLPVLLQHQLPNGQALDYMTRLHPVGLFTPVVTLLDYFGGGWSGAAVWGVVSGILLLGWLGRSGNHHTMHETDEQTPMPAKSDSPWRGMAWLALITALTLAIPLLISIKKPIYKQGFATLLPLPLLMLAMGMLLDRFAPRRLAYLLLAALLVAVPVMTYRLRNRPRPVSDRQFAAALTRAYHPGDIVIYAGIGHRAVRYYINRWGILIAPWGVYPPPIRYGWPQNPLMYPESPWLPLAADALIEQCESWIQPGQRVLVCYGSNLSMTHVLHDKLDARWPMVEEIVVSNDFYHKIRIYAPRGLARGTTAAPPEPTIIRRQPPATR